MSLDVRRLCLEVKCAREIYATFYGPYLNVSYYEETGAVKWTVRDPDYFPQQVRVFIHSDKFLKVKVFIVGLKSY